MADVKFGRWAARASYYYNNNAVNEIAIPFTATATGYLHRIGFYHVNLGWGSNSEYARLIALDGSKNVIAQSGLFGQEIDPGAGVIEHEMETPAYVTAGQAVALGIWWDDTYPGCPPVGFQSSGGG